MKCKKCNGFGYVQVDEGYNGMPQAIQCDCVIDKSLKNQAERAWTNLSLVPIKETSLLDGENRKNLLISSTRDMLRLHLRTAFFKIRNPSLFLKVVGDHTLMSAWLGSLHAQGVAVADPDFQRHLKVYSLEDLAESPDLLVIRLGTKMARNSAMPEVLVETLEMREHLNRPTWLVEEPSKPLEEGHLSWSPTLQDMIGGWKKIFIENQALPSKRNTTTNGKVTSTVGTHKRIKL